MNLNFTKKGDVYVAEFTANGPFALHLEVPATGHLRVRQSSVQGGQYALVDSMPITDQHKAVVDRQFAGDVWPMYMQVEVGSQPTLAVVTEA